MGCVTERTGLFRRAREGALQTERRARMSSHQSKSFQCAAFCLLCILSIAPSAWAATKYYEWEVAVVNYTRNCVTKPIVAVNGLYPGPTIEVTEEDRVIVKVINNANTNVTIHWHGIRQWFSAWQDGVGYVTQCSIQPGDYFTYDFIVTKQRGTAFWHAHVNWVRATVYGAFLVKPKTGYPFAVPYKEFPVLLGEWWNGDVETIERTALAQGGPFPLADALTINGFPGVLYNCSGNEGLTHFQVESGKTYLLRIINVALNTELFFGIANHDLTVVEADSMYVKPLTVSKGIVIGPGQTINVLVTANQPPGSYYAGGKSYTSVLVTDFNIPAPALAFVLNDVPVIPTSALFQYKSASVLARGSTYYPILPESNDTDYKTGFDTSLKTLYPEEVPTGENARRLLFTVGTAMQPCTTENPCLPQLGGYRLAGAINNISFHVPTIAILQAYYFNIPGVYSPTFPDTPPIPYDYTNEKSPPAPQQVSTIGTRVSVVEFGTTVELVLQGNNNLFFESHPFHLHGYFFYVLGQGFGDFNPSSDPGNFNNYDPPSRFTVDVPRRGWVAIRFKADNPGAWLLHCHLEKHLSWGMQMVFIVKNGAGPGQCLPPPPKRLTAC